MRRPNQVWLQRSMLVWTKRNKLYITKKKNHTIGQRRAKNYRNLILLSSSSKSIL